MAEQDDMNLRSLHMFADTVSLDASSIDRGKEKYDRKMSDAVYPVS